MTADDAGSVTAEVEVERKYDVDAEARVPVLASFATEEAGVEELRAVYFDTRRGDLEQRRITLRRREGGHDDGWHAKLPGTRGRLELTAPIEDGLPDALAGRLAAVLRGRRVWPVARIATTRSRRILSDEAGHPVAELVDDLVVAVQVRGRVTRRWREWEVELLPGAAEDRDAGNRILDEVEAELVRVGAAPASSVSKLARALGRTRLGPRRPGGTATALGALLRPLGELVDSCVRRDPEARADEPEAVHQYRVDVRRIRSVLASFRDVLDPSATEPLRRRLHRLQTELEPARDAEVRRETAHALIARGLEDPENLVERYVVARAEREHVAAMEQLRTYLASFGYRRLLDDLDRLVARPPLGHRALDRAVPTLRDDLVKQVRRAVRRLDAAGPDDLESLHEGRKAVRRLRYVVEALTKGSAPVFGDVVVELGRAAKTLQDELGDARDADLLALLIDELAAEAELDGHDPSALRAAAELERANAASLLEGVPEARRVFDEASAAVVRATRAELVARASAESNPDLAESD